MIEDGEKGVLGFLGPVEELHIVDDEHVYELIEMNEVIKGQVEKAITNCDVILFILDGKAGVTALDESFAKWIRRKVFRKDSSSSSPQHNQHSPQPPLQ